MQWSRLHCVFLFKTTTMFWHATTMFRHDNNDVLARQQRCFGMTTTMFWHDNNDVFKRQ